MNKTRRLSIVTLALVMMLVAIIALPASAYVPEDRGYGTFSKPCSVSVFYGTASSLIEEGGEGSANASTYFSHGLGSHTSSGTAYVSGKFWHYPIGSSASNYRTTTLSSTVSDDTSDPDGASSGVMTATALVNRNSSMGVVFSIESTHRLILVCNGQTNTQTISLVVGEPAMK